MKKIELTLKNPEGMHARPAGIFVKMATGYKSKVEIIFNGQTKNAKSIMTLMSLGLKFNDVFTLMFDGEDEELAAQNLTQLVENQFQL